MPVYACVCLCMPVYVGVCLCMSVYVFFFLCCVCVCVRVGSPYYMSPEILNREGYDTKCDVWSVGCVIAELMTGRHTFPNMGSVDELRVHLLEQRTLDLPERFCQGLRDTVGLCLIRDPKKRPSCRELLAMKDVVAWKRTQGLIETGEQLARTMRAGEDGQGGGNVVDESPPDQPEGKDVEIEKRKEGERREERQEAEPTEVARRGEKEQPKEVERRKDKGSSSDGQASVGDGGGVRSSGREVQQNGGRSANHGGHVMGHGGGSDGMSRSEEYHPTRSEWGTEAQDASGERSNSMGGAPPFPRSKPRSNVVWPGSRSSGDISGSGSGPSYVASPVWGVRRGPNYEPVARRRSNSQYSQASMNRASAMPSGGVGNDDSKVKTLSSRQFGKLLARSERGSHSRSVSSSAPDLDRVREVVRKRQGGFVRELSAGSHGRHPIKGMPMTPIEEGPRSAESAKSHSAGDGDATTVDIGDHILSGHSPGSTVSSMSSRKHSKGDGMGRTRGGSIGAELPTTEQAAVKLMSEFIGADAALQVVQDIEKEMSSARMFDTSDETSRRLVAKHGKMVAARLVMLAERAVAFRKANVYASAPDLGQ